MKPRSTKTTAISQHLLNVAPITFEDAVLKVGVSPFRDKDQMRELRRQYAGTHIFLRRRSRVLSVPVARDILPIGDAIENIQLHSDLGLCANLIRESLIRYLHSLGRAILDYNPIIFLAGGKDDNLLVASLPEGVSCPPWLAVRLRYHLSVRSLYFEKRTPLVGLALDVWTSNIISASCAELVDAGMPLVGRYVERLEMRPDSRLQPKRYLIGRIGAINEDTMHLDDAAEGYASVRATDVYLEPRRENFEVCLRHTFGSKAASILDTLHSKVGPLRSGLERLFRIRSVMEHLSKLSLEIIPGTTFSIGKPLTQADGKLFPPVWEAPKPVYVFNPTGSRTDTWHDRGLDQHGPYDRTIFHTPHPRIAVICQAQRKGQVEQFLHKLLEGVPTVTTRKGYTPYAKGLLRKYFLEAWDLEFFVSASDTPEDYSRAVRQAIEAGTNRNLKWNLALVQIDERFHQLHGDANPYLVTKAAFLSQGIPVQEFEFETISLPDAQFVYVLNNLALASYAKLGGIPWLLKASPAIAHELVFGLGSASVGEGRLGHRERVVGITTVFTGDGNYILENRSKAVALQDYPQEILRSLRETVQNVRQTFNWQPHDSVRLIFHAFKPFRDAETEAVKTVMADIGEYDVEYAFLHVMEDHPFVLFDEGQPGIYDYQTKGKKGQFAPLRGRYLKLSKHEVLMSFTGAREVKRVEDGLPAPLLLRLHQGSTFVDMTYLARQAFAFSCHSWRSFFPAPMPITVMYSQLIARLLGALSRLSRWNPDAMLGQIGRTRWFL